jgi:hypothetical protein
MRATPRPRAVTVRTSFRANRRGTDGDVDFVIVNLNEPTTLPRNDVAATADRVRHSWVRRLERLGHLVTLQPAALSA